MSIPSLYQIKLYDPVGILLKIIPDFFGLDYAKKVNDIGTLILRLPTKYYPLVGQDCRIEVERSVNGGSFKVDMETGWLVRDVIQSQEQDGQESITITAFDGISILKRRVIAYNAGTSQAKKTALNDDMMKAIVRENFVSATDTLRNLDSAFFGVQADTSQGASLSKSFAWRNVLIVLQEISQAGILSGQNIYFDVVLDGTGKFEFRTYRRYRGDDHRWPGGNNSIILDPQLGNLANCVLEEDYKDQISYQYVGGQGEGADRAIYSEGDNTQIGVSPFGRIEDFQDARNTDDSTFLVYEARTALRAARPKLLFSANLVETQTVRYGIEYGFGDFMTCQFRGLALDCRLDVIHIVKEANAPERIDAKLQATANVV